ncbi:MAG: hypothetical protein LBK82_08075, partial [Planctomycetaceae bacterium]|nr:hypothetical protein [Planctomycetaceae bacterium]
TPNPVESGIFLSVHKLMWCFYYSWRDLSSVLFLNNSHNRENRNAFISLCEKFFLFHLTGRILR